MKRRFWILAIASVLVLAIAAPAAFGGVPDNNQGSQYQQFFNQMFGWHQQWIDQAQKNGQITPEQANLWLEHINYMRSFHSQYGFGPMGYMMGGLGGNYGYGGMMGWDNNNQTRQE
ncbi:MAG: hypothetical protein ACOY31_08740 [Bacillota bacterium]